MAKLAKAAGFKYLMYTTVHCDGFVNWPSNLTDYNIVNTPVSSWPPTCAAAQPFVPSPNAV